jgi:galactose mutarotase-like enzyme
MAYEITIADPGGGLEATFVPELGMVCCSLRHEGEELLHQRKGMAAYASSGSTFALPLLYPFANRVSEWSFDLGGRSVRLDPESPITHLDGPTGTAIHGLLAASPHWAVTDADRNSLTAELDFGAVPDYMAAFPFPHRLRYTATLDGSALAVSFTVLATGGAAVPISFGFHPYLTLPGSDRRDWQVSIPVARQTLVDERMIPTGATVPVAPGELDGPLGERTFDAGYDELLDVPQPTFVVADSRRRIALTYVSGYTVSQVYAPEEFDLICYEPMTAPVNAMVSGDRLRWVAPGETFEAIFTISVEKTS